MFYKLLFTLALTLSSLPSLAETGKPSEAVTVSGQVTKTTTFTVADLQALNRTQFEGVDVYCQSGELKQQMDSLTGIPLKLLLEQAGLDIKKPKDFRKIAIIAKATDDYWVTYSYGEIFNQKTDKPVLVYYAKNGQPLDATEGAIAIMPLSDERMGGRQVKWLESIEVRVLSRD